MQKSLVPHCRRTSLAFARLNAIFLESVLLTALALSRPLLRPFEYASERTGPAILSTNGNRVRLGLEPASIWRMSGQMLDLSEETHGQSPSSHSFGVRRTPQRKSCCEAWQVGLNPTTQRAQPDHPFRAQPKCRWGLAVTAPRTLIGARLMTGENIGANTPLSRFSLYTRVMHKTHWLLLGFVALGIAAAVIGVGAG